MGKTASRWGSYAQLVPFSHPPTLTASLPAAPPRWLKGHYSEAHSAWAREHNSCFTGRSRQNIECPKKCPFHRLARPAWKGLFSLIVRASGRSCPRPASSPGQGASGAGKASNGSKRKVESVSPFCTAFCERKAKGKRKYHTAGMPSTGGLALRPHSPAISPCGQQITGNLAFRTAARKGEPDPEISGQPVHRTPPSHFSLPGCSGQLPIRAGQNKELPGPAEKLVYN